MAHDLNFNQDLGRHSFVSVKTKPWHLLGVIVDKAMTSKEAIQLGGMDYQVSKGQVFVELENRFKEVPNRFCTFRTDTNDIFGMVSDRYEVVQNSEGFIFFDSIVGTGKAIFETAGVLGNGETIFVTAKLPDYIRVNGSDDVIEKYLLLTMNHSGEKSIMAMFTPVRVVCNNTLQAALNGSKSMVKIRHTKSAKENLDKAMELLNLTNILSKNSQNLFSMLAKQAVTDVQMADYINSMVLNQNEMNLALMNNRYLENIEEISTRKKNIINDIKLYNQVGIGQKEIHGTAWGLYNAVTGYYQNMKTYTSDEVKFKNIIGGSDSKVAERALKQAYEFVPVV